MDEKNTNKHNRNGILMFHMIFLHLHLISVWQWHVWIYNFHVFFFSFSILFCCYQYTYIYIIYVWRDTRKMFKLCTLLCYYYYYYYNKDCSHSQPLDWSQIWNTCTFSQHPVVSCLTGFVYRRIFICFSLTLFFVVVALWWKKEQEQEHNHEYLREIFSQNTCSCLSRFPCTLLKSDIAHTSTRTHTHSHPLIHTYKHHYAF